MQSKPISSFLVTIITVGLEWLTPEYPIFSSIGCFYVVVFLVYYAQSHVSGAHCVCPNHWFEVVYASSRSVTYVLLYVGIIAQGYQLRYYLNGGKILTYDREEG